MKIYTSRKKGTVEKRGRERDRIGWRKRHVYKKGEETGAEREEAGVEEKRQVWRGRGRCGGKRHFWRGRGRCGGEEAGVEGKR